MESFLSRRRARRLLPSLTLTRFSSLSSSNSASSPSLPTSSSPPTSPTLSSIPLTPLNWFRSSKDSISTMGNEVGSQNGGPKSPYSDDGLDSDPHPDYLIQSIDTPEDKRWDGIVRDRSLKKKRFSFSSTTSSVTSRKASIAPVIDEEDYNDNGEIDEWLESIRVKAQMRGGVWPECRRKFWVKMATRYLDSEGINWPQARDICLSEEGTPFDDKVIDDEIFKDLHRTGSDRFCGSDPVAFENQQHLKKVLVAYSRWNPSNGYCQGFNIIAAIILDVMEFDIEDSLKVMIFLIEKIFPKRYFTDNLIGLKVDMSVVNELITRCLPDLTRHLESLNVNQEITPQPLVNIYTLQWFLTLFTNCLSRHAVLRIWDLLFLYGNEVLIRTCLGIWETLSDRIQLIDSADDFCTILAVFFKELKEMDDDEMDGLVKNILNMVSFPFPELEEMRKKHTALLQSTPNGKNKSASITTTTTTPETTTNGNGPRRFFRRWRSTVQMNDPNNNQRNNRFGSRTSSPSSTQTTPPLSPSPLPPIHTRRTMSVSQ